MSRLRVLASVAVLSLAGVGVWVGARSLPNTKLPTVDVDGNARVESCLACHLNVEGLGRSHDPARIGCSACHLGDPTRGDEEGAHKGMSVITGGLSNVSATCGRADCHASEAGRVASSPMAGSPGVLAVDRYAFGERDVIEVRREDDFRNLSAAAKTPAEDHARKLCGSCHLAQPKDERGDLGFASRGGGCVACHLTAPEGPRTDKGKLHPGVGADVPERRCEGCHARSGRISLSYRGIAEVEPAAATRKLPDGRPITDTNPDVHARAGLTCIDCHSERDVMGDGRDEPRHASAAVEVRCQSCHDPNASGPAPDADKRRVEGVLRAAWTARGMPSLEGRAPIIMAKGTPLWRTDRQARTLLLATTGETRRLREASDAGYHRLVGHERLSCQSCHSQWAPRCVSCHTSRDANARQTDHISGEDTLGAWVETAGGNSFGPPALAVDSSVRVSPFVEGMQLRVTGIAKPVSRTFWAPIDPHTTAKARACATCHPGDAKTYPREGETTRAGARLLNERERNSIARVGDCIGCHSAYDDAIYVDFAKSRVRLAAKGRALAGDAVKKCRSDLVHQ